MSQRTATIESLPMAFEVVKAMRADGLEWGEGYRPLGRQALAEIIQGSVRRFVLGPFCQTLTNLSPKMTANCVLASNHSRGGRFHASAA